MSSPGGMTAALRIARRDALRHKARSILVIVMIALPVLALTAADVLARTMQLSQTEKLDRSLGHADGELTVLGGNVTQYSNGGGYSSDGEMAAPGTPAFAAELRKMRTVLPTGSRLIQHVNASASARSGNRLVAAIELSGLDLRDPMTAGLVRIVRGRPPGSDSEAAVTDHLAARLHLAPGSTLGLGARTFTVVGIAHNPQAVRDDLAVTLPSAVPVAPADAVTTYLVASPHPLTWPLVKRLNAIGVGVSSRYVAEHPPAGVPTGSPSTLASRAREVGIATVAVGLAVLEVVLLAGAAFAVGARRQRRDLALVAAAGGDERDIRRVVLAGGFVLGLVGAVVGGIGGILVGRAALPLAVRLADRDAGHFDLRLLEIAVIAVVGVGTGVAAAILPARTAARADVVAVLSGRRGVVATTRRVPLAGVGMIVLGAAASAYAAHPPARFTLVLAGAVIAEIGFIVCAPAVVGATGRAAGLLPLPMRLAVRDASRHRGRTGPAVAAVLAAVAGSVAVSAWITSQVSYDRSSYQPHLRVGQSALEVFPDSSRKAPTRAEAYRVVSHDLPVTGMTAMSTTNCNDAQRCTGVYLQPRSSCSVPNHSSACAVDLGSVSVAVGDVHVLDALLGHHVGSAAAALDRGAVVVFSPAFADNGRATLTVEPRNSSSTPPRSLHLSSYVVDIGHAGVAVNGILSVTTAARLHIASGPWGYLLQTSRLPTQSEQDRAYADLSQWSASLDVERGFHEQRWNYGLLALAGAAALVTLGATAVSTALSAADSRPDLVTLAAVGAAPRLRRRFAANQAGTVAVLGTVLGALAGLIPAYGVIRAHGGMPFAVPWQTIGIVVIGVPVLAAAVTGALTRSRLPSERRAT